MNHKGKDVHSDWLADHWDERSVLGHARIRKGRMKGDDPEIDTAQTSKRFDGLLALQEKIRKTLADSIPNNFSERLYYRQVCAKRGSNGSVYTEARVIGLFALLLFPSFLF